LDEAHYTFTGSEVDHVTLDMSTRDYNAPDIRRLVADKAPNLTINIQGAIPEPLMVSCFMWCGLLIQAGILAFNAIGVYYLSWLRAGRVVAPYGYPIWACGTISITIGVSICARVVQNSTLTVILDPVKTYLPDSLNLRLIRFQKKIPELKFPAYLILDERENPSVKVSRRKVDSKTPKKDNSAPEPSFATTFGTFLTLAGFICQNIGTRELHWSAAVLQLGGTLRAIILRALLRRFVGNKPDPYPIPLQEAGETSQIVSYLEGEKCCMLIETAYYSRDFGYIYPDNKRSFSFAQVAASLSKGGERLYWPQIERMINIQLVLARHEPDLEDIVSITSNLCNAMIQVLTTIKAARISFHHLMLLKDNESGFETVQPTTISFSLSVVDYGNEEILDSSNFCNYPPNMQARDKIQAMLSLSYNESHKETFGRFSKYDVFERIIGHGSKRGEGYLVKKKAHGNRKMAWRGI
jgi:hypothetical protein